MHWEKNINKNFENLSLLFEIKIYEEFEDYIYITCNSLKEPKCSQQLGNHNPTSNCVILLKNNHPSNANITRRQQTAPID